MICVKKISLFCDVIYEKEITDLIVFSTSMCHHELWPTSVSHPFSFLNSSLGLAGGQHYQKIIIPIFRLVLQNFAILCYFHCILFYRYLFILHTHDYTACMDYIDTNVRCPKKAVKLNHSFNHWAWIVLMLTASTSFWHVYRVSGLLPGSKK